MFCIVYDTKICVRDFQLSINPLNLSLNHNVSSLSVHRSATVKSIKCKGVGPGWSFEYSVLLMPQADYFSTVITLSSPLCRSGLWGLMDTAMYNSLIISIQFDN